MASKGRGRTRKGEGGRGRGRGSLAGLTERKVKEAFGERSIGKGEEYLLGGHVVEAVDLGDSLWGRVQGREYDPYVVTIGLKDGEPVPRCTCPMGGACKHGAALALRWARDPGSFTDSVALLRSLGRMQKGGLVSLMERMLRSDPSLVERVNGMLQGGRRGVDLKGLVRRLESALELETGRGRRGEAAREAWRTLELADGLVEDGRPEEAAHVSLLTAEAAMDAICSWVDDSNGSLGDAIGEAAETFVRSIEASGRAGVRSELVPRVARLCGRDGYDLGTEEMLTAVATEGDAGTMERELVRAFEERSPGRGVQEASWVMVDIYEHLGMTDSVVRVATEAIGGAHGPAIAARALMAAGRREEAARMLATCPLIVDEGDLEAAEMVVEVAGELARTGLGDTVDVERALAAGRVLLPIVLLHGRKEDADQLASTMERLGLGGRWAEHERAERRRLKGSMRSSSSDGR